MTSISVVIPAYNVEKYISAAVDSVLSQTLLPSEILIINDGSTDNTSSLLTRYEGNELIKIIHTKNRGLGEARNKGLEECSSEYIYFFDSDDVLELDFIEKMHVFIRANNSPDMILFSGQSFIDEMHNDSLSFQDYSRKVNGYFDNSHDLISMLMNNKIFFSSACLYISKKNLWVNNDIRFKSIIHEDEEVIFKILAFTNSSLLLEEVFFNRRVRKGSIMTSEKSLKHLVGLMTALQSMYDFRNENHYLYENSKKYWKMNVSSLATRCLITMAELKYPMVNFVLIKSLFYIVTIENFTKLKNKIIKRVFL